MDIALATCLDWPQGHPEDQLIVEALAVQGFEAAAAPWDHEARPKHGWLLRSVWDYHHRLDPFLAWVEARSRESQVWNSPKLVRWNAHKQYLQALQKKGLPVIPTLWDLRDQPGTCVKAIQELGWTDVVVKPTVSASAHRTFRLDPRNRTELEGRLADIHASSDAMIQPYLPSVEGYGERSFFFFDGLFTHAVRRPPALSQALDQDAMLARVDPTEAQLAIGKAVLEALPHQPLYARIDLVANGDGDPMIMEVELIEPRLFLREAPEAARILAAGLVRRIREREPLAGRV
jgi:hypothetical protein